MPDKICSRCLEQLENWMKFKELCVDANTTLLLQSATEIHHELPDQLSTLPKKNDLGDVPETSSDFPFKDVSFTDTDSLFKNNIIDESTHLNFAEPSSLDSTKNQKSFVEYFQDFLFKNENPPDASEDKVKKCSSEEQRAKWKEKYSRVYMKKYHCGVCSKHFSKFNILLQHDNTDHKDIEFEAKCLKCGHFFVSNQRLELHNTIKHKEKIHECDICGVKCSTVKSLNVHMRKHSDKFQCDVCCYCASSNNDLQNHKLFHSSDTNICCQICSKRFKQRQALVNHMKLHITTTNTFKCDVCYKKYQTLEVLQEHKKSHDVGGVVCEMCGLKYKNKVILRAHTLRAHEAKGVHQCNICDKRFSTKGLLTRHLNSHYKQFDCKVCKSSFTRADSLELHMNKHSVTIPIQCDKCDKQFNLKRYYVRHLARKHCTKNV